MEKIVVDDNLYFSAPTDDDKWSLVKYLNDEDMQRYTLRIPYPYTELDAEEFLARCRESRKKYGRNIYWMLRNNKGEAIGGIGFKMAYGPESHRDELGYWIGKEFQNNGIMTKALKRFCDYALNYLGLVRIEALTCNENRPSERVLEKCGFTFEGTLRKVYEKKGKHLDARLYSLVP